MNLTKEIKNEIFREYDIRGVYPTEINADVSYTIGKAYGTYIKQKQQKKCIVGYDNRYSSKELESALIQGIISTGVNVLDLGLVTTPMYYYACIKAGLPAGIMVTASHNPKDDNGFKFSFDESGNAKGKEIQDFYQFVIDGNFDDGDGVIGFYDVKEDYCKYLLSSVQIDPTRQLKVIIDCGNGTTTFFAPMVYNATKEKLVVLYGKSDPDFPNHHPDPCVEENLKVLKDAVVELQADVGIAFDGDGDRVGIVNEKGEHIPADQLMILLARDILPNSENKRVLYDVKCTKALPEEIERLGGEAIISRTGNSYTKAGTKENDCVLGGEYSGHIFFRDKFLGFDSGLYAGLRVIEILSKTNRPLSELLEDIPKYYSTEEIKIQSTDRRKKLVVQAIKDYCKDAGYPLIDIDGVRIELDDGWALIRYSNTGPHITARFEGKSEEARDKLKEYFMTLIDNFNI
ncbi:MAG: phosphomannomutase/phosphoglucomutase [Bacilli bacterium]|nr:phosphomannomutase/phosphoglucomutase [Bacilli bacterium]